MEQFIQTFGLEKERRGRKPYLSTAQLCALFIVAPLFGFTVTGLARSIFGRQIESYHIFRRYRIKKVYKILRKYQLLNVCMLFLLTDKKLKLRVDGMMVGVAKTKRAKVKKIKRLKGKKFWGKRKRKLYSEHKRGEVILEEEVYGVLLMVVCDEDGMIYDLWFVPASMHEKKALEIRLDRSPYLREIFSHVEEIIGDLGYIGVEGLKVVGRKVGSKEEKAQRQIVESVLSAFVIVRLSRWRKPITLLTYFYGIACYFSLWRFCL